MDKQQAYDKLWNSFGILAFEEHSVPDDDTIQELIKSGVATSKYPYITYQVILDDLDSPIYPMATLWDRNTSWSRIDSKLAEISEYLDPFQSLKLDEGYMYVTKNTPWAQRTNDPEDRAVIGYILNLGVEFLTEK